MAGRVLKPRGSPTRPKPPSYPTPVPGEETEQDPRGLVLFASDGARTEVGRREGTR